MAILGAVIAILALWVIAAAQSAHRRTTGVAAPSRRAMRNIRKLARDRGIEAHEQYDAWLDNKRRRELSQPQSGGTPLAKLAAEEPDDFVITPKGISDDGFIEFDFHCLKCGGWVISAEDPVTRLSKASCKACGQPLGKLWDIEKVARRRLNEGNIKVHPDARWGDVDGKPL